MDHRRFLLTSLTGALAIPFGAAALQAERPRPPVIGSIASGYRSDWASGGRMAHLRPAFEDGLRDEGYVAGQNVVIDYRFGEGDPAKLPDVTAALIARNRVLRGSRPAEIPIERPTRFELIINLKTAKALGLTIPQTFQLRAEQIIE
jgi:ABC-type uncharacterized transport system substrate-binding protein